MNEKYDVIIVGTGVAGLFCALNLPENMKVLMITKEGLEDSSSFLAQGGICVLKDEEDFKSYVEDTLKAGRYENDKMAVETMIKASRGVVNELICLGVNFDKQDGKLVYTKEAAHSTNRILHHKDITGKEITSKLLAAAKTKSNINMVEYCTLIDIIKDSGRAYGIVVNYKNQYKSLYAKNIVLATGGVGGVFDSSTNYPHITGDGVAIAIKNSIKVEDISYIQIHPTTLYSKKKGKRFLISEAVRGEGAYLLNPKGERFVDELLPRDVVSNRVSEEMKKFNTDHVYLSVKHLDVQYIKNRFPNIYKACKDEGHDFTKDLIPIAPSQHYFMGGISVNLEGKTSLKNLYAVGETSRTGVHGANRLASNSLLEGLVFAKRAANDIKENNVTVTRESLTIPTIHETPEEIAKSYKNILLEAIKREDEQFYVRWFNGKYKCG